MGSLLDTVAEGEKRARGLGRLPGDLRLERRGCVVYLPLTSALLVSVALTLLLGGAGWLLEVLGDAITAFGWIGSLPGDLRIERDGMLVVIPLASALVLSVLATLLVNAAAWLWRRRGGRRDDHGRH